MFGAHLKTIFSFRIYHRLAFATRGQTAWFASYLFFLSLLIFHFAAAAHIRENLPVLLKNFPQVTFEKGFLTQPKEPVSMTVPQTDFIITFDASRQTPPTLAEMTEKKQLMLVSQNRLYMPSSSGVQSREIPPAADFTASPDFLNRHRQDISAALGAVGFFASLLLVPFIMLFDFCVAAAVGLFFKLITRSAVPRGVVFKWAVFMLGPLAALWYVRLWINIPLFTLAQIILCIIYMQQIFNTLPEDR